MGRWSSRVIGILFLVVLLAGPSTTTAAEPVHAWTRQFGSAASDAASAVAVDEAGDILVAGTSDGALPGQRHRGLADAYVRRYGPGGAERWTRQFGTRESDTATGVGVDRGGNIYVAGTTRGVFVGQTARGDRDVYVRSFSRAGALRWTRQFGSSDQDDLAGVAVSADGKVTVAGHTRGTLPGQEAAGANDGFVRQYSSTGALQWTRQFGTSDWDEVTAIAVAPNGDVAVVGWTFGVFAGQTSRGGVDAFVRLYDPDGGVRWTRQLGTAAEDSAWGVAVDGSRNVAVAGLTAGAFPGKTNAGDVDAFVRTYAPGGALRWTRQFGTPAQDAAAGIVVDGSGRLAVVGTTGGRLAGQSALGSVDAFVRRYGSGGGTPWTEQFGTSSVDSARGIAVGSTGDVAVVGQTAGRFPGQTSRGAADAFARLYRP